MTRLSLPKTLQKRAIEYAHEGHMGASLTKRLLRSRVWFPKMDTMIEEVVKDCLPCQANTEKSRHEFMIINYLPKTKETLVSVDFSSMLPTGEYILVIKYERARYPVMKITKSLTERDAIRACTIIFVLFGIPKALKSDNGPAFRAIEFETFLEKFKIKHIKITPYNPESNGGSEKIMDSLNNVSGAHK